MDLGLPGQEAQGRIVGPGQGEVRLPAGRARQDLVERQLAALVEHPGGLAEQPALVLDVDQRVLEPDQVEGLLLAERHVQRVAPAEGHAVVQVEPAGEGRGGPAVGVGKVEPGDNGPELTGQRTGGAPDTGAHVEDVHALLDARQPGQLPRGLLAADVELVERGSVVGAQLAQVLPRFAQGAEQLRAQAAPAILLLDRLFVRGGHALSRFRTAEPSNTPEPYVCCVTARNSAGEPRSRQLITGHPPPATGLPSPASRSPVSNS